MKLPKKLQGIELYNPPSERAAISLDSNESCLPLSKALEEAVEKALSQVALHRYPDPLSAGCRQFAAPYFGVPTDCLTAGNGSDGLIDAIFGAFLDGGDTVLCTDPDFSMYRFYADIRGLRVNNVPRRNGLPSVEGILEAANRAQCLIFSNPCNPTGQGMARGDILKILDNAPCLVVVDEAYMDFFGESVAAEAACRENVIVLKTCSKAIGLAGIRLGFAIACPERAALLRQLKSPYDVSSLTQAVGEAVLSRPQWLRARCEDLIAGRKALFALLSRWAAERDGVSVTDTVTNFVLLHIDNAPKVHTYLWNQGIGVRCFQDHLRITAGTGEEHAALMAALAAYS